MQQFFDADGVNVGDNHAIAGTMDGVAYNLWGMKEPDYVMRMMVTGGPLAVFDTCKEALRKWTEGGIEVVRRFKYACPFDWHFRYHHAVDNHNNLRHALPSIEDSWATQRWEIRVFLFVLAISEVNAFLALWYFTFAKGTIAGCPTLIVFRLRLAWQLIRNSWIAAEETAAGMEGISSVHTLMLLTMRNITRIGSGHPTRWRSTSSTSARTAAVKRSEPIAHALQVDGCVTNVSQSTSDHWMRRPD